MDIIFVIAYFIGHTLKSIANNTLYWRNWVNLFKRENCVGFVEQRDILERSYWYVLVHSHHCLVLQ